VAASTIRFLASWIPSSEPKPDEAYEIDSRTQPRKIKVHVYKPPSAQKPCPVLINWHGSGFVIPMHGSDDLFCRRIAQDTGYTVIDASYALAPEDPFPAALEDVEDMILHVLKDPEQYDVKNIALSGFSAGGNLALAAASNPTGSVPQGSIHSVIAFYAVCDLSIPPAEKKAPDGSAGTLPSTVANIFNECYMLPETDPADPRISVSKANIQDFPPNVLILTAGLDNLAPEAEELAKRLEARQNTNVTMKRAEGVGHGWDKNAKDGSLAATERDNAYALVVTFLLNSKVSE
jgi:acetyl esterase/lipase